MNADHWLKHAPPTWTRGRLKNLISSTNNGVWGNEPAGDGSDVRCIRAADFDRVRRRATVANSPIRSIDASVLRQHRLTPGDLILEKSGGGDKQPVGMAVLYEGGNEDAVCTNFCSRITPASGVDSRFLAYIFSAAYGQGLTSSNIKQTTGIQNLDAGAFLASPWAFPAQDEQRRIADFLDAETARIDELCSHRRTQVDLLEERLLAIWAKVIIEDGNASGWTPVRRFITAITDGPFGSSLTSNHYSTSGARVIRLGNLGRAEFRDQDAAYIPMEYFATLRRHEVRPGDLIMAGLGDQNHPLGRTCIAPDTTGPAIVKADCFRFRLDQTHVLNAYAAWALSSPPVADQISLLSRGSTRARINLEVAREIKIPTPSKERQVDSVTTLTRTRADSRAVTRRCRKQLDLLAERRQALITAAVTGQFDVSTASGRNVTDGIGA